MELILNTAAEFMRDVRRVPAHIRIAIIGVIALFVISGYLMFAPPQHFPEGTIVSIEDGTSLVGIAEELEEEGIIRSAFFFRLAAELSGRDGTLRSGDYNFPQPINALSVIKRITFGDYGLLPVRVTIPEGATSYQIAAILEEKLYDFDAVRFAEIAEEREGYLFPETYFFLPTVAPEKVADIMERTFNERIAELAVDILSSEYSLHELLTMASLLEKEARRYETRQTIAGILWNRLEIDMPLQVDAVFGYIERRGTFHPSFSDLEVESPYNTYRNIGLPPGPIANPGIESIRAALNPIESNYLFYLTGRDGTMHYSERFDEHVQKKRLYLN